MSNRANIIALKTVAGLATDAEKAELANGTDIIGNGLAVPAFRRVMREVCTDAEYERAFDAKYGTLAGPVREARPNEVLEAIDMTFTNDGMMRAPVGPLPSPSKIARIIAQEERLRLKEECK